MTDDTESRCKQLIAAVLIQAKQDYVNIPYMRSKIDCFLRSELCAWYLSCFDIDINGEDLIKQFRRLVPKNEKYVYKTRVDKRRKTV